MSRIFLVAGESSGDIHGANLVRAIRTLDPGVICEGLGGHRMADAGMTLRFDLAERAIMGFTEVVKSYPMLRRLFYDTVEYLEQTRPDALVLIDYPGFNIRLAQKARALKIPVIYYISPQIWAWKKGRLKKIAKTVDKMLTILPFEETLYRNAGVDCCYVGHPLLDQIAASPLTGEYKGDCVIGLLPGSREQEIGRIFPVMAQVAREIHNVHPEARFLVPCVDATRELQVRALIASQLLPTDCVIEPVLGKSYEILSAARFCLVASGTATLETALFGVPMVILYKMSSLSFQIAKRLVHIEHVGLANILAGRGIVPEFLQDDASVAKVLPVALNLIADSPDRKRMLDDLAQLKNMMGAPGASARAAQAVLDTLRARQGGKT